MGIGASIASTSRWSWLASKLADALASSVLGLVLGPLGTSLWNWVVGRLNRPDLLLPWETALLGAVLVFVGAYLARRFSAVRDLLERVSIWALYLIRMIPYWLREGIALGHPANGQRNPRFKSEVAFFAASRRREAREQIDHGQYWRDSRVGPCRVTWISTTGELIAVALNKTWSRPPKRRANPILSRPLVAEIVVEPLPKPGEDFKPRRDGGPVEILAVIPDSDEVDRRLMNYEHVLVGDLRWARRRAYGWDVPLPPEAEWWRRYDVRPERPPLPPPQPSLGETDGAYLGLWEVGGRVQVNIGNEPARDLYHFVDSSPTGFAWGYGGSGPWDLARSVLADRLGYIPNLDVVMEFKNGVVATLSMPAFSLTFSEVDAWIDSHAGLFARDPRAGWPRRRPANVDQGFTIVRSARPGEFDDVAPGRNKRRKAKQ